MGGAALPLHLSGLGVWAKSSGSSSVRSSTCSGGRRAVGAGATAVGGRRHPLYLCCS